jgi:hypothetical protein
MLDSSRRRFLEISAGLAGRVAASGIVSLPILASMSKRARASGGLQEDRSIIIASFAGPESSLRSVRSRLKT